MMRLLIVLYLLLITFVMLCLLSDVTLLCAAAVSVCAPCPRTLRCEETLM